MFIIFSNDLNTEFSEMQNLNFDGNFSKFERVFDEIIYFQLFHSIKFK